MIHAQSRDHFEHIKDKFALTEPKGHGRQRAELHATSGQTHQVRRNTVEFHHHHADDIGALRNLISDSQQFLYTQAVRGLIEER